MSVAEVRVAVASAALLGESPFWHPRERALYYCDIPGKRLYRFDPAGGALSDDDLRLHPRDRHPSPTYTRVVAELLADALSDALPGSPAAGRARSPR